jgi:putative membrane protein
MNTYLTLLTLHLICMTAWMAGMFYLPRLYVYHADAPIGGPVSEQFKIMERRLLRAIINPAMILTWVFGISLAFETDYISPAPGHFWLHAKFGLLILMQLLHAIFARTRRQFARDERPRSAKFYKIVNEMVTVVFIGIVGLAVLKPF